MSILPVWFWLSWMALIKQRVVAQAPSNSLQKTSRLGKYSGCGSCEAELSRRLWPAEKEQQERLGMVSSAVHPKRSSEWTWPQHKHQSPDSYASYLQDRSQCTWNLSGTLSEHNSAFHGREYPRHKKGGVDPPWDAQVHVCTLPAKQAEGNHRAWSQRIITRIGPLYQTKRGQISKHYGGQGYFAIVAYLPFPKHGANSSDTFVVEAVDALYDEQGKSIDYPPMHVHHSETGGDRGFRLSMRHADMTDCKDHLDVDNNACTFMRTNDNEGWHLSTDTRHTVGSVFNIVGNKWNSSNVYVEYGRTYEFGPSGSISRRSVSGIDFSITNTGSRYGVSGITQHSIGVAWRVFTMLERRHFRASFLHSHAAVAFEMFVLRGNVEYLLPQNLVRKCYLSHACQCKKAHRKYGRCTTENGTDDTFGLVSKDDIHPSFDLSLDGRNNPTAAAVLQRVLSQVAVGTKHAPTNSNNSQAALMCQYKSRNAIVDGERHVRSAARATATASLCDDWVAEKGSQISLLVFSHPPKEGLSNTGEADLPNPFLNHIRWFAWAS